MLFIAKVDILDDSKRIMSLSSSITMSDGTKVTELRQEDLYRPIPLYPVKYNCKACMLKSGKIDIYDYDEIEPQSKKNYIDYLSTFSGIGKSAAIRVYNKFGTFFFNMIVSNPSALMKVKGFNPERIMKVRVSVLSRRFARKWFKYLKPLKVSDIDIINCYTDCLEQNKTLYDVKNNPYPYLPFSAAECVAEKQEISKTSEDRIKGAIMETIKETESGGDLITGNECFPEFCQTLFTSEERLLVKSGKIKRISGSTCIPTEYLKLFTVKLADVEISDKTFYKCLSALVQDKKLRLRMLDKELHAYRMETYTMENNSSVILRRLCGKKYPHDPLVYRKINNSEAELGIKLSNQQTDAVVMALENQFSVLTGGPGTGKTSVQRCLIDVFQKIYPEKHLILCAPTGKAAKRMGESTGQNATTVHRMLHLVNGSDEKEIMAERKDAINDSLIIIDETSMLDNAIFNCLIRSIGTGNHVLMVGDIAQLPSIGAGTILRSLINSDIVPVTRLTKTFRQADESIIPINAARIKAMTTQLEFGDDFKLVERKSSEEIAKAATEEVLKAVKEDGIENVVCLTAYRRSTVSGSNALNERIRKALRGKELDTLPYFIADGVKIYEGDRVMFTQNSNGLTNGDTGVVESIIKENGHVNCKFDFEGTKVTLSDESLDRVVLAYALTIHKSQGSEYRTVIMVIDKAHQKSLNNSIIFTGLTRASVRCITIGEMETIKKAILTKDASERHVGLLK